MSKKIVVWLMCLLLLFSFNVQAFAQEDTQELSAENSYPPILFDIPSEDVFGDWEIVEYYGATIHNLSPEEIKQNEIAEIVALGMIGLVPGNSIPTIIMSAAEALTRQVDFAQIGGVYSRAYYVRKIIDPDMKDVNVPVPYQFAYFTIFYNDRAMRNIDIEYIEILYDGGPRLDNN